MLWQKMLMASANVVDTNTLLLIHSDSYDGDTTFVDSSSYAHTMTAQGTFRHVTAQAKFGATSAYAQRSGQDCLTTDGIGLGTGTFTIDMWVYQILSSGYYGQFINTQIYSGGWQGWSLLKMPDNTVRFGLLSSNSLVFSLVSSVTIPLNEWVHLAVGRDSSGVVRMWFNGVVVATSSATSQDFTAGYSALTTIGTTSPGGSYPYYDDNICYYDEIRISDVYRYGSGDFVPPTAPY